MTAATVQTRCHEFYLGQMAGVCSCNDVLLLWIIDDYCRIL